MEKKINSMKIIILLIISALFISGCSVIGTMEKTGCKLLPGGNTKDHCWQDAAVRLSMPSICYFIQGYKFGVVANSPPMTKCFLRIAEKEKNPSICGKIVEGHPNGYTQDDCYMATAIAAKNNAYCDYIKNNESRGFGMIIVSIEECYIQVGKRPVYCVDDEEPVKCMSAAAINMLDVTICEDAGAAKDKGLCLANAIEGIQKRVMQENNTNWNSQQCKRFNDPNLKYICSIFAVAAFDQNTACDNILETQFNEVCKLFIQFKKTLPEKYDDTEKQKFEAECNKFTIPEFKGGCFFAIAHEIELTGGNVGNDEDRDKLYLDSIEFYLKGCELLSAKDAPPEAAFICIMMPSNILKPEYCPKYKDATIRDDCYAIAAMDTGDCSKIDDAETKTDCKDSMLLYYKAMQKKCGKLSKPEEYKTCQETFKTGFFMQALGVKMPETLRKFMK